MPFEARGPVIMHKRCLSSSLRIYLTTSLAVNPPITRNEHFHLDRL